MKREHQLWIMIPIGIGLAISGAAILWLSLRGGPDENTSAAKADQWEVRLRYTPKGGSAGDTPAAPAPAHDGPLAVAVKSAQIGRLKIRADFMEPDERLIVLVEVSNNSADRKLDFKSWSSDLEATDELGNRYSGMACDFSFTEYATDRTLYPGAKSLHLIAFERPVAAAETMRCTMPAAAYGLAGVLAFEIRTRGLAREDFEIKFKPALR